MAVPIGILVHCYIRSRLLGELFVQLYLLCLQEWRNWRSHYIKPLTTLLSLKGERPRLGCRHSWWCIGRMHQIRLCISHSCGQGVKSGLYNIFKPGIWKLKVVIGNICVTVSFPRGEHKIIFINKAVQLARLPKAFFVCLASQAKPHL